MSEKTCPKCRSADIATSWHRGAFATTPGCSFGHLDQERTEHLHYCCRNCSYDWTGPTADQQTA